jgi:hypothetical protein
MVLGTGDPLAIAVTDAIRGGDTDGLTRLLAEHPDLATARIGERSLVHVLTDWPGHRPGGVASLAIMVAAGADVNARFTGAHTETPLHWAASNDDVEMLDALLDAGAEIDAIGAVIAGGTPLDDARAFGQWRAAHRLVERGARTTIQDAAALGLMDRLERYFAAADQPGAAEINLAFWYACHGGQLTCARYLLDRGAELSWLPGWENRTPLDAAERSGATEVAAWLRDNGATSAA